MAEITVYHHLYNKKSGTLVLPREQTRTSVAFLTISRLTALIGIILIIAFYAPSALAWGQSVLGTVQENYSISNTEIQTLRTSIYATKPVYEPPFDPTLPKTNRLVVPSIGIKTEIKEATLSNYESALRNGVWRVSDFGAPNANDMPIILAAHRYGYLVWTDMFRRQSSFYNLPKLKVGDTIEIDWQQRQYVYEVYGEGRGTQITDYSADLILYTCVDLNGTDRIFKYARLITN